MRYNIGSRVIFNYNGKLYSGLIIGKIVGGNTVYKVFVPVINQYYSIFATEIDPSLVEDIDDWENPNWDNISKWNKGSWKFEVPPNIRHLWHKFSIETKILMAWDFKNMDDTGGE